jgi:hypothetical protein
LALQIHPSKTNAYERLAYALASYLATDEGIMEMGVVVGPSQFLKDSQMGTTLVEGYILTRGSLEPA